jgi:hypothetical protein
VQDLQRIPLGLAQAEAAGNGVDVTVHAWVIPEILTFVPEVQFTSHMLKADLRHLFFLRGG